MAARMIFVLSLAGGNLSTGITAQQSRDQMQILRFAQNDMSS
jgi:hypothetical protein